MNRFHILMLYIDYLNLNFWKLCMPTSVYVFSLRAEYIAVIFLCFKCEYNLLVSFASSVVIAEGILLLF